MVAEADNRALQVLLSRRSVAALKLHEPGPDAAQVEAAVGAALLGSRMQEREWIG